MSAWVRMKKDFNDLIASGDVPAFIAVMPDAPWSNRASYYVDSQYIGSYIGSPHSGVKLETAYISDLIPHVDSTYRTIADRTGRAIGGYSMGGYGALRYLLAYADKFSVAIALRAYPESSAARKVIQAQAK